jgi:hypothetical protein
VRHPPLDARLDLGGRHAVSQSSVVLSSPGSLSPITDSKNFSTSSESKLKVVNQANSIGLTFSIILLYMLYNLISIYTIPHIGFVQYSYNNYLSSYCLS